MLTSQSTILLDADQPRRDRRVVWMRIQFKQMFVSFMIDRSGCTLHGACSWPLKKMRRPFITIRNRHENRFQLVSSNWRMCLRAGAAALEPIRIAVPQRHVPKPDDWAALVKRLTMERSPRPQQAMAQERLD